MQYHEDTRVMTISDWMITLLVLAIPLVNIIMYLVWAFSGAGNLNRRNFCRASLLWFAIGIAIWTFIAIVFGTMGFLSGAFHRM